MTEHMAGSWGYGWNGDVCAIWGVAILLGSKTEKEANAAYIVRAVNAHEGLVAALQGLVDADKWWADNQDSPKSALSHYQWAAEQARAALSAAKE